jgi:hypothetical protein
MSGAIAAAVFNPTDVLKVRSAPLIAVLRAHRVCRWSCRVVSCQQVRFQADPARTPELRRYKSVVGAVVEIVRTEGLIAGLYKAHRS